MREDKDVNLERVARELRKPVDIGASFDARVMAGVRALPRHVRRGVWSRISAPRTIRVRPLWWAGVAAAAAIVVAFGALHTYRDLNSDDGRQPLFSSQQNASAPQRVQFVLVAPSARKVAVVGDFNGWDAEHAAYQAMHRGGGVWSVTAQVPAGHHRYSFVVDDSVWMADPTAPRALDNDYGLPNSAIVVGGSNNQ